ncbi:MAG: hypothetical protein ACE5HR_08650, partial [bacterium]
MCGIAGIISSNPRELGPLLKEMLGRMHHRGPDGAGYVIGEVCERKPTLQQLQLSGKKGLVAMGHVRLAITGGADGLQPFQSENRRVSMLHNGEIYNYNELAQQLSNSGTLRTGSDSEVLMRLIEETYTGDLISVMEKVLRKLDGVYALAVTDQQHTVIARDPVGVRQLYFYIGKGLIAFASERKSLRALGGEGIEIHRLPPGHMMVLKYNSYQLHQFWNQKQLKSKTVIKKHEHALASYD